MTVDAEDPAPAGLRCNPHLLLRAVTATLLRQPQPTRATEAAVALLQRLRTAPDTDAGDEIGRLRATDDAIAATAQADAAALAAATFGPPEAAPLEAHLQRHLPDGAGGRLAALETITGGYSKQTSLFDWAAADGTVQPYVLRRDVRLQHIGSTVRDEYPLVVALHRLGMPVAKPVLLATGVAGMPEPFMVMRRLPGSTIGGPMGAGEGGFDPAPALAQVLARLHALPVAALGVPGYSDRSFDRAALLADIEYWHGRYLAHRETPSPTLEAAFAALVRHAESGLQPGAVVHGDCGFYNLLFDGERFVALLDWEMAHLGSPVWDLAYVRQAVEGFGSYADFLDRYVSHGGTRPSPAALAYYELFAIVRGAVMCVTGVALFNRGEPVPLDLLNVNCTLFARFVAQMPAAIRAISEGEAK